MYDTIDNAYLIQFFKDDATAFNAKKIKIISSKGIINNFISSYFMRNLLKMVLIIISLKELTQENILVKKLKVIPGNCYKKFCVWIDIETLWH